MQIQGSKDFFRFKESKLKNPKLTLSHNNILELVKKKKNKKDREKMFWQHRQEYTKEQNKEILATDFNITKIAPKKKLKIRRFNYDKKSYYANNCIKPLKN